MSAGARPLRPTSRRAPLAAVFVVASSVALGSAASAQEAPWPMAGRDAAHSGSGPGPEPPYRKAWTAEPGDAGIPFGIAVGSDAVIAVTGRSVIALDTATGDEVWRIDRDPGPAGSPAIHGELVIHAAGAADETELVALRLEDGEEEWRADIGSPVRGAVTVEADRVYAGTLDGRILAIDAAEGSEEWSFEAPGAVETAIAVADGVVLSVAQDTTSGASALVALDSDDGRERWRVEADAPVTQAGPPAAASGTAFVSLGDALTYAVDLEDGAERWTVRTLVPFSARQVPAAGETALFLPNAVQVRAMDPESGAERWSYQLTSTIGFSSPALIAGSILFGDQTGQIGAVDSEEGLLRWRGTVGPGPIGDIGASADRLYVMSGSRRTVIAALEHDPDGILLAETSPSELVPERALINFVVAAAALGAAIVLLFRFVVGPARREA